MTNNIFSKFLIILSLSLFTLPAQDEQDVDAIEKARQAKEAAEKAAAEASAATEAAIEAAAQKAAKEAREDAKRKREEDEARKLAEAKAAEEAELDAAATAAAEAAKRKMAEELGLEYEPEGDETSDDTAVASDSAEAFIAKESLGINLGLAASVGIYAGETFVNIPTGVTFVLTTPISFNLGPLNYTVSFAAGTYSGDGGEKSFNPNLAGIGGNLTLANLVFAEGHVGLLGEGTGFRGFAGLTLDRLMKNTLQLPVNVLLGSELFYSSDMAGIGNSSGWASFGIRLDYGF